MIFVRSDGEMRNENPKPSGLRRYGAGCGCEDGQEVKSESESEDEDEDQS